MDDDETIFDQIMDRMSVGKIMMGTGLAIFLLVLVTVFATGIQAHMDFHSNAIVSQYTASGAHRCWELHDTMYTEDHSERTIQWDGIRLTGDYSIAGVHNNDWPEALRRLGLKSGDCITIGGSK